MSLLPLPHRLLLPLPLAIFDLPSCCSPRLFCSFLSILSVWLPSFIVARSPLHSPPSSLFNHTVTQRQYFKLWICPGPGLLGKECRPASLSPCLCVCVLVLNRVKSCFCTTWRLITYVCLTTNPLVFSSDRDFHHCTGAAISPTASCFRNSPTHPTFPLCYLVSSLFSFFAYFLF